MMSASVTSQYAVETIVAPGYITRQRRMKNLGGLTLGMICKQILSPQLRKRVWVHELLARGGISARNPNRRMAPYRVSLE
jgi:hypothetical protein